MRYLVLSLMLVVCLGACSQPTPIRPPSVTPSPVPTKQSNQEQAPPPPRSLEPTITSNTSAPNQSSQVPIQIELQLDRAPRKNEQGTLTWIISANLDSPQVHAFVELPDSIRVVSGSVDWQGSIAAGERKTFTAVITVTDVGVWDMRGVIRSDLGGGDAWSSVNHLYLTVNANDAKIGLPSDSSPSKSGTNP